MWCSPACRCCRRGSWHHRAAQTSTSPPPGAHKQPTHMLRGTNMYKHFNTSKTIARQCTEIHEADTELKTEYQHYIIYTYLMDIKTFWVQLENTRLQQFVLAHVSVMIYTSNKPHVIGKQDNTLQHLLLYSL